MNNMPEIALRLSELGSLEEMPFEMQIEKQVCEAVLKKQVEAAVAYLKMLDQRIEMMEQFVKNSKEVRERTHALLTETLKTTENCKQEDDLAYMRLQDNSIGTVTVTDPSKVPLAFRKVEITFTKKVEAKDEDELRYYASVFLKRPISKDEYQNMPEEDRIKLQKYFKEVVAKQEIQKYLRSNPGFEIPGIEVVQEKHLRFDYKSGKR